MRGCSAGAAVVGVPAVKGGRPCRPGRGKGIAPPLSVGERCANMLQVVGGMDRGGYAGAEGAGRPCKGSRWCMG